MKQTHLSCEDVGEVGRVDDGAFEHCGVWSHRDDVKLGVRVGAVNLKLHYH